MTGIGQHTADAEFSGSHPIDFLDGDLGLLRNVCRCARPRAVAIRTRLFVQLSGRNNRKLTIPGASPRASVVETNDWQLPALPRADAHCAATPTEWLPFVGSAVLSITRTAS
jgi:hypothetical protein